MLVFLHSIPSANQDCKPLYRGNNAQNILHHPVYPASSAEYVTLAIMNVPSLTEIPGLWETDGSLRDIYVENTMSGDWFLFLEHARAWDGAYTFQGKPAAWPSVEAIFESRNRSHLLVVPIHGVNLHCHFFVSSEIEMDIDPRQVKLPEQHDAVLGFVKSLACKLNKPIAVTPENGQNVPYLSFNPKVQRWMIFG